jgi:CRP-like cAMP-binding protein
MPMNPNTPMARARQHPFVRKFPSAQADKFAALAREVTWAAGQVIYREGEVSPDFYLIETGSIALEVDPPTGPVHVDTLAAGEEFGWAAVLAGPRVLQARAMEPARLLAFDGASLGRLCETDTAFGYAFMRLLLASAQERLQALRLQVMDSRWSVAARAGA